MTVTLTLPYSFLYYSKFTKPNFPEEMKTEEDIRATLRPRLLSHIDTYLQAKIEPGAEAAPHATAVGPPASPSTPAAPGPSNSTTIAAAVHKRAPPSRDFVDPENAPWYETTEHTFLLEPSPLPPLLSLPSPPPPHPPR